MNRRAFTLVEVMVVMGLMVALTAVLIPTVRHLRRTSQVQATGNLVRAVAAAITAYPVRDWTWRDPATGKARSSLLWDLDDDHELDGDPTMYGAFPVGLADSGYRGLLAMAQPPLGRQFVDHERRIVDAWKRPLRIRFAADTYGSSWFGLHSLGPDGLDGTADDIASWKE